MISGGDWLTISAMSLRAPPTDLTQLIAARRPGERFRAWLSLTTPPHTILAPLGDDGAHFAALTQSISTAHPDGHVVTGIAIVDGRGRLILCGPEIGPALLPDLARLVDRWSAHHPLLTALTHAGVLTRPLPTSDRGVRLVGTRDPAPHYDPRAWELVVAPSPASVAAALQNVRAGDVLWYWLAPDAPQPLILHPLRADPFGLVLSEQADAACANTDWRAQRGRCVVAEDGALDFQGDPLDADSYWMLAEWVRAGLDEHPALARLHGARFSGAVPDPFAWDGVLPSAVPGTAQEVAEGLAATECWFWLSGGLLTTLSADADPDGDRFQARVQRLTQRYPGRAAISGLLTRLTTGAFLFAAEDGDPAQWQRDLTRFLEIHAPSIPRLSALARSRFVRLGGADITAAATLAPGGSDAAP